VVTGRAIAACSPAAMSSRGELGRGGMAVVHRARDLAEGREVALKLLLDPNGKDRFLSEARKTAQIRHPNVVTVYETGQDGTDTFLCMELLAGETLEQRLRRDKALAPRAAAHIAAEICGGLAASHALGMVHRDIKPSNVFLAEGTASADTTTKVIDFGIAKRVDGSTIETDPGMLVGTFAYMAPEQIKGGTLDGRADLYALGVMLYQMLSGRLPFLQDTAASLIHAHLTAPAPRPPERRAFEGARAAQRGGEGAAREVARGPAARRGRRARCDPRRRRRRTPSPRPRQPPSPSSSSSRARRRGPSRARSSLRRSRWRSIWSVARRSPPRAAPPSSWPASYGQPAHPPQHPPHGPYGAPSYGPAPLQAPGAVPLGPPRERGFLESIPSGVSKRIAATRSSCSSSARCSSASARISWQRSGRSRSSASLRTSRGRSAELARAVAGERPSCEQPITSGHSA
jgi:serine/threonine protein kinase